MIEEGGPVITDRLTARVLGLLLVLLPILVDITCFIFASPELKANPRFFLVLLVPSLPPIVGGALLMRKARSLPEDPS